MSDAGPGFDEEAAAAGAEQVRAEEEAQQRDAGLEAFALDEVPEEKVRHALFVGGDGLHAVVGVGEYDWMMTQRDLDRIAPPLTRILNRYDATRAMAAYSDELAVGLGFGLYGWRSILERVAVLRAQEEAPEAGRPPGPPPGPPGPTRPPPPPPAPPAAPEREAPVRSEPERFPGAGAPADLGTAEVEVVPGYVTRAERIRQARQTGEHPNAIPAEAPTAS